MVAGLLVLAGCGGSGTSTPTLDAARTLVIAGETLVPAGQNICHVRGTIQNSSAVRVDVNMQWTALNVDGTTQLGTTSLTVNDLNPGEQRRFESTGFINGDNGLVGCARIVKFVRNSTTVTQG